MPVLIMETLYTDSAKKGQPTTLIKNYAAILHAMHDLVFVLDENRVFIDFFHPGSDNLYLPPEAFLQKKLTELPFSEEIKKAFTKKLDAIEKTGKLQTLDYTLPMPSGLRSYNANISGVYSNENSLDGFVIVARDTTDSANQQKRYQSVLAKYNLAAKSANFGVWELDYVTEQLYWNEGMEKLLGCTVSTGEEFRQLLGKYIAPDDFGRIRPLYLKAREDKSDFNATIKVDISSTQKHIEIFASFSYNVAGIPEKVTGIALDITEKKRAEEAVRQSDEHYRLLAENTADLVVLLTPALERLYVSPACLVLTGYTPEEFLKGNINTIIHPDDQAGFHKNLQDFLNKLESQTRAYYRIKHWDGRWIYIESILKAIRDTEGNVINILSTSKDVTKQHEISEALRQSGEKYRMLADNIVDMVVLLTPDMRRLYVSPSSLNLTGYTPEELIEGSPQKALFFTEDDRKEAKHAIATMLKGEGSGVARFSFRRKTGERIMVEAVPKVISNAEGDIKNFLIAIRNISREVQAEQALRKSEEQYRLLADNIVDMVLLLSPSLQRLYVSPSCFGLLGYPAQELMERQRSLSVFYSIEDEAIVREAQKRVIYGSGLETIRYNLQHKNGNKVTVEAIIKGIGDENGQIQSFLLTIRNVTPQVLAENALRQSEEQYRMLADNIVDMVALYDSNGRRLYVSPSSKYLFGYEPHELTGNNSADLMHPDDFDNLRKNVILKARETQQEKFFVSARMRHKNGQWLYCEITIKAIRENGQLTGFVGTTRNITEWKKDQQALFESEQRYRLLADNIFDMLTLYSTDYKRVYVSPSSIRLTGYTPEELTHLDIFALIYPDDRAYIRNCIVDNVQNGRDRFQREFRGLHKTGDTLFISGIFTVIRDDKGHAVNVLVTSRDITAEKKAGIALKESEEKYRSLVEASGDIILILDETGKYLFANEIACKYIGRPVSQVIGKNIYDFFDPETSVTYITNMLRVLETGQKITFENAITISGKKIWLRNTLQPIYDSVSKVYAVMLCVVDITDIRNYAETLLVQNKELKKIAYLQSHIVRAPLANIQGIVNLLDENRFTDEDREYIGLLKTAAAQLDGIIREIVDRAIEVKQKSV